jgi:multicomponent Na+:H+ antiporter subunit C
VNLVIAATVGVLFGTGAYLVLKADLMRVVAGLLMISNAANLTLIGSGLSRGQAPILPALGDAPVADPLVQAMTLTALVIGLAFTALLLVMVVRVFQTHRSVDLDELARAEALDERLQEEDEEVEV